MHSKATRVVSKQGQLQPRFQPTVAVKWAIELDFSVSEIAGWNGHVKKKNKPGDERNQNLN